MRQSIDSAPRDGKEIWVEDDQSAYDVAHWSLETNGWVWKNGQPIRIVPTHWSPIAEPQYQEDKPPGNSLLNDRVRRCLVASAIAAALLLNGLYFQTQLIAFATKHFDFSDVANVDSEAASSSKSDELQGQLLKETATADLQWSLDKERTRVAALTNEVAQFRVDLETAMALSAQSHDEAARFRQTAEKLQQSLLQQQADAATHKDDLLVARREIETQATQLRKAAAEAAHQKQSADAVAFELQESLQREQEKTAALTQEIDTTRGLIAQTRRELEEADKPRAVLAGTDIRQTIETKATQSQIHQEDNADATAGKLRASLDQEQRKTATLAQEIDEARETVRVNGEQQHRALDDAKAREVILRNELAEAQRDMQTRAKQSQIIADDAMRQKQAAETAASELRGSLQREELKRTALTQQLDIIRKTATATTEEQRRAIEEIAARAAASASELDGARREIEIQQRQAKVAFDDATRQKLVAEAATAKAQNALQREQTRSAALTQEVSESRRALATNAEQQRQALSEAQTYAATLADQLARAHREIEEQSTRLQIAVQPSSQARKSEDRPVARLRQLPDQDRDATRAMTRDLSPSSRRSSNRRETPGRMPDGPAVPSPGAEQLTVTNVRADIEPVRLIARAKALIGEGNISAARIVLERAVENGNAVASFMLAETYDPAILSAWGTYGTRGESAKARELYAKAHNGGIREAKGRIEALRE